MESDRDAYFAALRTTVTSNWTQLVIPKTQNGTALFSTEEIMDGGVVAIGDILDHDSIYQRQPQFTYEPSSERLLIKGELIKDDEKQIDQASKPSPFPHFCKNIVAHVLLLKTDTSLALSPSWILQASRGVS